MGIERSKTRRKYQKITLELVSKQLAMWEAFSIHWKLHGIYDIKPK